jgi:hypothetical protein
MICTPVVCSVQPSAYMIVPTRSGVPGRGDHVGHLEEGSRPASPQMRETSLGRVALDVLLQELEDAARVLQRRVDA